MRKALQTLSPAARFARLLVVFITTYLFVATMIWGYTRLDYSHTISDGLRLFAQNDHDAFVKDIFDTGITKAKTCLALPEAEKKQCEDELKIFIATQLHEETLLKSRNISDSIHFIKREGNTLYTMNWNGELKISHIGDTFVKLIGYWNDQEEPKYHTYTVHLPPSNKSVMRYINLFSQRCTYFDLYDYNACQVTVSIPLDNNNNEGYVVSMVHFTEEDQLWIIPVYTPLILYSFITTSPGDLFRPESWPFVKMILIMLIAPPALTYIYWRKYLRVPSKK